MSKNPYSALLPSNNPKGLGDEATRSDLQAAAARKEERRAELKIAQAKWNKFFSDNENFGMDEETARSLAFSFANNKFFAENNIDPQSEVFQGLSEYLNENKASLTDEKLGVFIKSFLQEKIVGTKEKSVESAVGLQGKGASKSNEAVALEVLGSYLSDVVKALPVFLPTMLVEAVGGQTTVQQDRSPPTGPVTPAPTLAPTTTTTTTPSTTISTTAIPTTTITSTVTDFINTTLSTIATTTTATNITTTAESPTTTLAENNKDGGLDPRIAGGIVAAAALAIIAMVLVWPRHRNRIEIEREPHEVPTGRKAWEQSRYAPDTAIRISDSDGNGHKVVV